MLNLGLNLDLGGGWKGGGGSIDADAAIIALFNGGTSLGGREGGYYRVSDLSTMFEDRGGATASTPAVVDGLVGTIKDKGPNARHLVAISDSGRGTLRLVGGLYYIETDGVDDAYSIIGAITVFEPHYMAMTTAYLSGNNAPIMALRASTSQYFQTVLSTNISVSAIIRTSLGGPASALIAAAPAVGSDHVIDALDLDASVSVGFDGGAFTTTAHASWGATSIAGSFYLNRAIAGTANTTSIRWYGGIYINGQPTSPERAAIVTRLGSLAGKTL